MRIVGGKYRGRPLYAPTERTVRPTSDRLRESLFNILSHRFDLPQGETRVLDLFAGTGALGLEALSRGAAAALFVEAAVAARALIRRNIEALELTGSTRILRRDATRLGPAGTIRPFDLVFCDPPYGARQWEAALASAQAGGWLAPGAICVVEETRKAAMDPPDAFEELERRVTGGSQIVFLKFN